MGYVMSFSKTKQTLSLQILKAEEIEAPAGAGAEFAVSGAEDSARLSALLSRACHTIFEMHDASARQAARKRRKRVVDPAIFRDTDSGLIRVVYKEISIRFAKRLKASVRDKILKKFGFAIRSRNPFVGDQYVVYHRSGRHVAGDLLDISKQMDELDEVAYAIPNFVSEYRRAQVPVVNPEQWHLQNRALVAGQTAGADAKVRAAWRATLGKPGIVVAVLDDGVDIAHPNLKGRIKRNPDPKEPRDLYGRDFFVPAGTPDHFDPRPKLFQYPYNRMAGNDIHGTPCAGVVGADGTVSDVYGAAPKCKILPVKVWHADNLAADTNVANAIRYAARFADVLSCSWSSGYSPDIESAIDLDAAAERNGKGVAIFCATGNSAPRPVSFPARAAGAIGVGASTDQDQLASYSQRGPEVSVVAPSNGGRRGIYTIDVSLPNRGFNTGQGSAGGTDGLHTNDFGGTSSATPLAVGVAALVLSVNGDLTRDEVRDVLEKTADKIGAASAYDANGHSDRFGFGRVNAEKAVAEAAARKQSSGGGGTKKRNRKKAGKS